MTVKITTDKPVFIYWINTTRSANYLKYIRNTSQQYYLQPEASLSADQVELCQCGK
jgi:hypothetical protein